MAADQDDPIVHDIAVWFARNADPSECYRAFEAYGHAMAAASAFENLMALMILKAVALRLDKRANANIQPADRPQLVRRLLSSTYDRLQRELCKSFKLSDDVRAGLQDGKVIRDDLAHNFWSAHAINLFSAEGVDVIATVCAHHSNHFRLLTSAIIKETGVSVEDYMNMLLEAPDRAAILEDWQGLLQAQGLN